MRTLLLVIYLTLSLTYLSSCTNTETLPVDTLKGHVGEQIKTARLNTGVSQTELATAVGLKKENIATIEQGFAVPTRDIIIEIEETLGIEIVLDNYPSNFRLK